MEMEHRKLADLDVSELGLGCMGMSYAYGTADEREAIATIHRALELGITFLDTAQAYGPLTNEALVGRAIKGKLDHYVIATKFNRRMDSAIPGDGSTVGPQDGSAEHVKTSIDGSLQRHGTDYVDLYYLHRVDPKVEIEETVGAMAELVEEGKVRHIGLSEAAPQTLRRARGSPGHRSADRVLALVAGPRGRDPAYLPRSRHRLRALLADRPRLPRRRPRHQAGRARRRRLPPQLPRFQGDNFQQNLRLAAKVKEIAEEKGVTPAQLALAWVLAQGEDIAPIPGTTRRTHLEENAAAADVELTDDDLARIDQELPEVAGERYAPEAMAEVNR
jgi:aryl-alcohol dehydrogenase-like predicted oxidoreductase